MDIVDIGFYACYLLLIVAVVAAVVVPLFKIGQNPKGLMKSGLGVIGLLVIFIISYALSGSEISLMYTTLGVGPAGSKLAGGGLIMFYITLVITVIAIVYSEISKAFQ